MSNWQPIETAPKDKNVLVVSADNDKPMRAMKTWGDWYVFPIGHGLKLAHEPTHWMPLPEPPTGGRMDE